jgi:hypothetical protein
MVEITSVFKKPEGSMIGAIATAILTAAIYKNGLPDVATMHATDANDINLEASRKKSTLTAAGVLSAITLLTRDANIFILGGVTLFALDLSARHANASNPVTGNLVSDTGYAPGLRSVS